MKSEAKSEFLTILESELVFMINMKVVDLFLSFPTHFTASQSDAHSSSYDLRIEWHFAENEHSGFLAEARRARVGEGARRFSLEILILAVLGSPEVAGPRRAKVPDPDFILWCFLCY
jgi:hypothetical protein